VAGPKGVPIIGQGGITCAQDALEFIIAGASAVGLGTALFYEPLLCQRVNQGIAEYLSAQGLQSVAQLVGTLRPSEPCAAPTPVT
jgi:dihydroorotate dehydrogenase (NAD+) catalytic subunit